MFSYQKLITFPQNRQKFRVQQKRLESEVEPTRKQHVKITKIIAKDNRINAEIIFAEEKDTNFSFLEFKMKKTH